MKSKTIIYIVILFLFTIADVYTQNQKNPTQNNSKMEMETNYIDKLKEGNLRFYRSKMVFKNFIVQREELAKAQNPHTIVVTCSDSRVSPEYIFDAGLGELFVIRAAGNVVDSVGLGTIEFAVKNFQPKQIVVMAHTSCAAVAAAVNGKTESNYINSILNLIFPAVDKAKQTALSEAQLINNSIEENAKYQIERILESKIVSDAYNKGDLKIYYALYDMSNGFVKFYERVNKTE